MSFGKLLAAGKSIVAGHDASRYRVKPELFLPKFISPKNPFVQPPNMEAPARTMMSPTTNVGHLPKREADSGARADSSTPVKSTARASVWRGAWRWTVACAEKLNVTRLLQWRRGKLKSTLPASDGEAVQGELSLDRVRVMRNDLSDADLEVVSVGGKTGGVKVVQSESAWDRLTTRIFETENNVI